MNCYHIIKFNACNAFFLEQVFNMTGIGQNDLIMSCIFKIFI